MTEEKPATPCQKFPKSVRLIKQADFDQVYHTNYFATDNTLVIKAVGNDLQRTRLGLSIGKKVGNAVVRNRWKRRIREAFRLQRSELPIGLDIVVRPRRGAVCDFDLIRDSLRALVMKLERRIKKTQGPNH